MNYQLDSRKILAYGNIMNKKQIFIFVTFLTSFDLQMTFLNDQSGRVPLPNLKNKKLHILIPHL